MARVVLILCMNVGAHLAQNTCVEVTGQLSGIGYASTVDFGTKLHAGHQAFTDHPTKPREMQNNHL